MTQGVINGKEAVVKIEEINALSGNTPTAQGSVYAWNQKGGTTASSTGNMTGVYDMVGGVWERTTGYIANGHEYLLKYAQSIAYDGDILKTNSTQYTTIYPYDADVDNEQLGNDATYLDTASHANYLKNTQIYGDAVREISSNGIGTTSWEGSYSVYTGLFGTCMYRGGSYCDAEVTGRFCFARATGNNNYDDGFRTIVIPIH